MTLPVTRFSYLAGVEVPCAGQHGLCGGKLHYYTRADGGRAARALTAGTHDYV